MVALPRIAKAEDDPRELKRLVLTCLGSCLPVALGCTALVYLSAPVLANTVYRMAELTALFRAGAPLTALFAVSHLIGAVNTALGQQKRSMYGAVAVSGATLAMTCLLAAMPGLRLYGVIAAQAVGQVLILLWNVGILALWRKRTPLRHSCLMIDAPQFIRLASVLTVDDQWRHPQQAGFGIFHRLYQCEIRRAVHARADHADALGLQPALAHGIQ